MATKRLKVEYRAELCSYSKKGYVFWCYVTANSLDNLKKAAKQKSCFDFHKQLYLRNIIRTEERLIDTAAKPI